MLNKKIMTMKQAKILRFLDFALGVFHAYSAYWFSKNEEMIGCYLTVALMIAYSLLIMWGDMKKENSAIYKQLTGVNACPIHSLGVGARGVLAVQTAPLNYLGVLGGIKKCL